MSEMSVSTHEERLKQEMADLLSPLRQHYEEVGKEIEEKERLFEEARKRKVQEVAELRRTRDSLARVLKLADPSFVPARRNGSKRPTSEVRVGKYSDERIAKFGVWLQEHAEELNTLDGGKGFYGSQLLPLYEDQGLPANNQSAVASMMIDLHERGLIRLVSRGGKGLRKYYKVVV